MVKNKKELEQAGIDLAKVRAQKSELLKKDKELVGGIKEYFKGHDMDVYETEKLTMKLAETAQYSIAIEKALKVVTFQELKNSNAIEINKKKFEALLTVKNKEDKLQACREQKGSFERINIKLRAGVA